MVSAWGVVWVGRDLGVVNLQGRPDLVIYTGSNHVSIHDGSGGFGRGSGGVESNEPAGWVGLDRGDWNGPDWVRWTKVSGRIGWDEHGGWVG